MSLSGDHEGSCPETPAGLEITFDHVKVAGDTVLNQRSPRGRKAAAAAINERGWL